MKSNEVTKYYQSNINKNDKNDSIVNNTSNQDKISDILYNPKSSIHPITHLKNNINEASLIKRKIEDFDESCILDCNKGEKLIVELNNHICLGEYELARTFLKQIIQICPIYLKYFFKILFTRGIPDKWLLSNQIRTSSTYLWLLYLDYKNELYEIPDCPKIEFSEILLESIEFDLLLSSLYYNSYECLNEFQVPLGFLGDLRYIFNCFLSLSNNKAVSIQKLRLISPNISESSLYLELEELFFDGKSIKNFDFLKQNIFTKSLKNIILSQPMVTKTILTKILSLFNNFHETKIKEIKVFKEILLENFFEIILIFVYFKDYRNIYEYLKLLPSFIIEPEENNKLKKIMTIKLLLKENSNIIYIVLMFSVLVVIMNSPHKKNFIGLYDFVLFIMNKFDLVFKDLPSRIETIIKILHGSLNNSNLSDLKKNINEIFDYKINNKNENKNIENDGNFFLLKHKVQEALLSNVNNNLQFLLQLIEDNFIMFLFEKEKIPYFFLTYNENLSTDKSLAAIYEYEELIYLIWAYSKQHSVYKIDEPDKENNLDSSHSNNLRNLSNLWKIANNQIFWNNYINFLRVNNEHCLSYPLKQAILFVLNEDFNSGVIFLHPLNNLKLILILLVWERFNGDIISQKQLLQVFWKSYLTLKEDSFSNDKSTYTLVPIYEDIIVNLDYLINFTLWIEKNSLGTDSKLNSQINKIEASNIYTELRTKSFPKVLSYFLKYLSFKEMYDYLKNCFPSKNKVLQKTHFHSSMIIFSSYVYYYILSKIEQYFLPNNLNFIPHSMFSPEDKINLMSMLDKIILFPYRLNIMGDIFNLIFLKFKDFIYNGTNESFVNDNESRISLSNNLENDNEENFKNNYYVNPYYLYQKRIFKDICLFLKEITKPLNTFDFNNLISMFDSKYLSTDISSVIESSLPNNDSKALLLIDLINIDEDFLSNKEIIKAKINEKAEICISKEKSKNIRDFNLYKYYLEIKTKELIQNVNELIFRFNIVNNPWLEIIQDANENYSFLPIVLQHSIHYLQISKKFHMWKTAEDVMTFFSLNSTDNKLQFLDDKKFSSNDLYFLELKLLKFFTKKKQELQKTKEKYLSESEIKDYIESLLQDKELKQLILEKITILNKENQSNNSKESYENNIKIHKTSNVDNIDIVEDGLNSQSSSNSHESLLNFEYFKFIFDISLSDNISSALSKSLLLKSKEIIEKSYVKNDLISKSIKDVIVRFETILQTNSENEDYLAKVIVSIKNLGSVQISEPSLYRDKLNEQLSRQNSLISLLEKVNDKKTNHKILSQHFDEALKSLEKTEKESMFGKFNYLKRFLDYVIKIGNIYYDAEIKHQKESSTNYLKLMQQYPKEIIANLFLKYNSEQEALLVSKMTKTNLISVILEFTEYYKKEIIYTSDFNNVFQNLIENSLKLNDSIKNEELVIKYKVNKNNSSIIPIKQIKFSSNNTNNNVIYKNNNDNLGIFTNRNNPEASLSQGDDLKSNKNISFKNDSHKISLDSKFTSFKENEEYVKGINKTFPLTMRILEFIYSLYFNNNNQNNIFTNNKAILSNYFDDFDIDNRYTNYFPLFISFYRFDYDKLTEDDQFNFWKILIEKYSNDSIFRNNIKIIFQKFYLYKTFYRKNEKFSSLYFMLFNKSNEDYSGHKDSSANYYNNYSINNAISNKEYINSEKERLKDLITKEKQKLKKEILLNNITNKDIKDKISINNNEIKEALIVSKTSTASINNISNTDKNKNFENNKASNNKNNSNGNEKNDRIINIYREIKEKILNKDQFSQMLPKRYCFIPEKGGDINKKLSEKLNSYLDKKICSNNQINFTKFKQNRDFLNTNNKKHDKFSPKFKDLTNISHQKNRKYYEDLCVSLTENGQFELALEIANNYLEDNKINVIQNLILEIVKVTKNEEKLIKLLLRLTNKKIVLEIVQKNWYSWKPQSSLLVLYLIEEEANIFELNKKEIILQIKKLEVFSRILERKKLMSLNTLSLIKLEENCLNNLHWVLNELMKRNSHDLCYQLLIVYNKYDEYKNIVKYSQVKLFLSSDNMNEKILALEILKDIEDFKIDFCLDLLKDLYNYQNKLLIINYLIYNFKRELSVECFDYLSKLKTSIKVFFLLPKEIQDCVVHLIDNPELILEMLLINEKFSIIKTIIIHFPDLLDENRIAFYCYKAMMISDFSNRIKNESMDNKIQDYVEEMLLKPKQNDIKNIYYNTKDNNVTKDSCSNIIKIVINLDNNEQIKNSFKFKNSPDIDLFMNFTDLCIKISTISEICFKVCNNCSKYLKPNYPADLKLLLLNLIDKVLNYLKDKLNNVSEYSDEHSIVNEKLNIFKKLTLLFRKFILKGIDSLINLELENYYSVENNINLNNIRDVLIDNDYLNLANLFCSELEIDSSRVDLELGLFCLKNRKFEEARMFFEKILGKKQIFSSNSNKSNVFVNNKNENVTEKIISILQGNFNLRLAEINKIHQYLLFRFSNKLSIKPDNSFILLQRHKEIKLKHFLKQQEKNSNIMSKIIPNFELESYFDVILLDKYLIKEKDVIIKETLYYIQKYGSEEQMLKFFVNNGMSVETVNFIIQNKINLTIFKEQILKKCKKDMIFNLTSELKKKSYLNTFQYSSINNTNKVKYNNYSGCNFTNNEEIGVISNEQIIKKNINNLDVSDYVNELLSEIIVYFLDTQAINDLISWFILMEDYIQACVYSIDAAFKDSNLNNKICFLVKAAENIDRYIELLDKEIYPKQYYLISSKIKKYNDFELVYTNSKCLTYYNKYHSNYFNNSDCKEEKYKTNINVSNNNNIANSNVLSNPVLNNILSNDYIDSYLFAERLTKGISLDINLEKNDLKQLHKTILLQIQVLKTKPNCNFILLSNDQYEKQMTVEEILVFNSELAYNIIQEYHNIDIFNVFMDCTKNYVSEKDYNNFENLLEILSMWNLSKKLDKLNIHFSNTWNELIKYAITISNVNNDLEYVESTLLPLLTNINDRVYVLISLNKLEEALDYCEEMTNNSSIINEIRLKAEKSKNTRVLEKLNILFN